MPKYRYTGLEEHVILFPRAFNVQPGEIVEADENPDPYRFDLVDQPKAKEKA